MNIKDHEPLIADAATMTIIGVVAPWYVHTFLGITHEPWWLVAIRWLIALKVGGMVGDHIERELRKEERA